MPARSSPLVLAGVSAALMLAACGGSGGGGERPAARADSGEGRLGARPGAKPVRGHRPGLSRIGDGLLYVPKGYDPSRPAPLAVLLHGAGGESRSSVRLMTDEADDAGLVLLAPDSRDRTWDVILGGFGPDVRSIDSMLRRVFERVAVDPKRVALGGFSDGASYALSLGVTNGDLFTHLIAFSPGFMAPGPRRGRPPVYVSHGVRDEVLPIDRCSRRLVPELRGDGHDVRYREFKGGHTVPGAVTREAVAWLGRP